MQNCGLLGGEMLKNLTTAWKQQLKWLKPWLWLKLEEGGSIVVVDSNDSIVVVDFVRSNIFCRFGVHRVIISDQGSHFYNRSLASLLQNYGVVHRVATTYHPQTDGQVKVFN